MNSSRWCRWFWWLVGEFTRTKKFIWKVLLGKVYQFSMIKMQRSNGAFCTRNKVIIWFFHNCICLPLIHCVRLWELSSCIGKQRILNCVHVKACWFSQRDDSVAWNAMESLLLRFCVKSIVWSKFIEQCFRLTHTHEVAGCRKKKLQEKRYIIAYVSLYVYVVLR